MARFLDTTAVSDRLVQIIKGANERLVLVSPYLKMNRRVKELLDEKNLFKAVSIRVVYGKSDLQPDEMKWLRSKDQIKTSFRKSLHAKCYLNEKEAVITSMNLHEFSEMNNDEMGISVTRAEEPALYDEICKEVNRIIQNSEEIRVSVEHVEQGKTASPAAPRRADGPSSKLPATGTCIDCGASVKLDVRHPFCRGCFKARDERSETKSAAKLCHVCGKSNKSTLLKPTCYDCYRGFKDELGFST